MDSHTNRQYNRSLLRKALGAEKVEKLRNRWTVSQLDSLIEHNDVNLQKFLKSVDGFKENDSKIEILKQTRELEAEIRQRREKLPISSATACQTEGFSFDRRTLRHRLEVEISLDIFGMMKRGVEINRSLGGISSCRSPHA